MAIRRARAIALLVGAAALGATTARGRAQSPDSLHIATIPIEPGAQVYFAKDMGFFAKANVAADIEQMRSGPAIAAALVSGATDVGFIAIDALAAIHRSGTQLVAIAPGTEYITPFTTRTAALVVPPNSPVQKAQDLNGKVVAVIALNGLAHTAVRAWIDKNGGDSSTVKFVEIPPPAMATALETGRVDAAQVVEPFVGIASRAGRVLTYGFESVSRDFITTAWCSTSQWAKDHAALVERFVAAMNETAAWANKNPQQSGTILASYLKMDPAVIATMTRVRYGGKMTPALVQPLIDISAKYGGFSSFPAQELLYSPSR